MTRWVFRPIPNFDERFTRQHRNGPPPRFPPASSYPGIVHHLPGPNKCTLPQIPFLAKSGPGRVAPSGVHTSPFQYGLATSIPPVA
eukprot:gene22765-biopygen10280